MKFNSNEEKLNLAYCRATIGLRLTNHIIDIVFFYIISFGLGSAIGIISLSMTSIFNGFTGHLIPFVIYGIIMAITEGSFHGKSIGKLITKTRAVNLDGSNINFNQAFGRNIIRAYSL